LGHGVFGSVKNEGDQGVEILREWRNNTHRLCVMSLDVIQSPSQATWVHWAALISVSVALSKTSAYTARPRIRDSASPGVPVLHHPLVFIAPTHGGIARMS